MEKFAVEYPESYRKYLAYIESEEDFDFCLRMEFGWNDEKYRQCLQLLLDVINDYKPTDLVPRPVMHFFTSGITRLVGTISHPDFLNDRTKSDAALKEYRHLISKRKEELLELQRKFISGELFMSE